MRCGPVHRRQAGLMLVGSVIVNRGAVGRFASGPIGSEQPATDLTLALVDLPNRPIDRHGSEPPGGGGRNGRFRTGPTTRSSPPKDTDRGLWSIRLERWPVSLRRDDGLAGHRRDARGGLSSGKTRSIVSAMV